jgi:cytochrome c5
VSNHSPHPLKRSLKVIVILALAIWGICILWQHRHGIVPPKLTPEQVSETNTRIAPVGAVYAGVAGEAQAQAAATAMAAAAMASSKGPAYDGTLDGGVIYGKLCKTCHETGTSGAPMLDHAHWDARLAQGKDTLYMHAIEGFTGSSGAMPAKGGNSALTDEQIHAAVDWMTSNLH